MIATKRDRQPPLDRVRLDALGHPLRHRAHQPWLLHVTDRWVGRRSAFPSFRRGDSSCGIVRNVLELRMTIELNLPAEATELVEQARLDERVRAEVDAGTALTAGEWAADDLSVGANGESEAVKKEIRRVVKDRYGFDMMMKSSAREEFRMRQLRQSRVASKEAGTDTIGKKGHQSQLCAQQQSFPSETRLRRIRRHSASHPSRPGSCVAEVPS